MSGRGAPEEAAITGEEPGEEGLLEEFVVRCAAVLLGHTVIDSVPDSGKVVVFDSRIPVKEAFYGMEENGLKGVPVWDSRDRKFVGMLTITDFIEAMLHFHRQGGGSGKGVAEQLETQKVKDWHELSSKKHDGLMTVTPEQTLLDAVRLTCVHRIHRLCVVPEDAENSVLAVLTLHRLLRFLLEQMDGSRCLGARLRTAGVGTYERIRHVTYDTPLLEVISTIAEERLSGLPILDAKGTPVDVYSRSDVKLLCVDNTFDIGQMTVGQALANHMHRRSAPVCHLDDTMDTLLRLFIESGKHRLMIVERGGGALVGLVSLSDLFSWLVREMDRRHAAGSE